MATDTLEAQADAILAQIPQDAERPFYTDRQLQQRERRRQPAMLYAFVEKRLSIAQEVDFVDCAWRAMIDRAQKMGVDSETVSFLKLRAKGCSIRDIAGAYSKGTATVSRRLARAQAIVNTDPYYDLWEVLAEIFELPVWTVRHYCLKIIRG